MTHQATIEKVQAQIEEYQQQKVNTQVQMNMLEGAIQALQALLVDLQKTAPVSAGPTSIPEVDDAVQNR